MTREAFFEDLTKKAGHVLTVLQEKNTGYNPTASEEFDPLFNYNLSADVAGITPEQSLIARTVEKLIRLRNILSNPENAGEESIEKTCEDLVGHTLLLWYSADEFAKFIAPPAPPPQVVETKGVRSLLGLVSNR